MAYSLTVKLTVLCSGSDSNGNPFEERTRTTTIERTGGRLLTRQKLRPGAEIQLCLLARPDQPTKVILGDPQAVGEGTEWSFQFAKPAADFWGVRFPDEPAAFEELAPAAGGDPVTAREVSASAALSQMSEQLVLLAAHADDHLHYCSQEMEVLKQRFARELQGALDSGTRQLRQLAKSTMETTFRSLFDDLARRATETLDDNLNRLRQRADEMVAQSSKSLSEECEASVERFQDRLEKDGREIAAGLEKVQNETQRVMQEAMQQAVADFQAGCADFLRDVLHSTESHKVARSAARRK